MKALVILICVLFGMSFDAGCGVASSLELENRISESARVLREMIEAPDGSVPVDLLKRSRAVVIFPSVVKAGLGVGGHYGRGVALRRHSPSGKWSPPAFLTLVGGSFGWQIGIQATDLVLLFMSDLSVKSLFQDRFTIGADASVAAGPLGRDASAATDIDLSSGILSYSRARGIFAGVSLKGSVIEVDWAANEAYYGSDLSIIEVFFRGQGTPSPAARKLIQFLNLYSR